MTHLYDLDAERRFPVDRESALWKAAYADMLARVGDDGQARRYADYRWRYARLQQAKNGCETGVFATIDGFVAVYNGVEYPARRTPGEAQQIIDLWSPARQAERVAADAEVKRLEAVIAELRAENQRLRASLANVRAAASRGKAGDRR